jgi:para-nitrobenzyl esterase
MKKIFPLFLLPAALVLTAEKRSGFQPAHTTAGKPDKQVRTANGMVEGTLEKSGVLSFKGIPFAAPPVGDLRWKEPQPAKNWEGVLKADHFGPRAMQMNIFGDMAFRSSGMSEDCLYLNVWTPSVKPKTLLPVLVYFYGGGFVAGDGSEYRYDGESMAAKGMVALTVNYRLGVFGFLAHPELSRESPYHGSGNYGVLDQAAALRWVQQNIKAFGGDPKRVTIAGESAGSISVSALMASPLSKDLIAGAIGESGSLLGALPAVPLEKGEATGVEFAKSVGAASLAELRAMPAQKLSTAALQFGPFRFSMTIDGHFFPKDPYAIYEAGEQAHVPLLAGWNSAEVNYFLVMGTNKPTVDNFKKAVEKLYGDQAEEVLAQYHAPTDDEVQAVATDLASDRFISFSTWKWIDLQARTGGRPVYRYLFSRVRPAKRSGGKEAPQQGAAHASEIEYALGNLDSNKTYAWTDDDYKVSRTMQTYFANFIRTGDPNGGGLPAWPALNGSPGSRVMHIDVNTGAEPEAHRGRYLLLDKTAASKAPF